MQIICIYNKLTESICDTAHEMHYATREINEK